MKNPQNLGLAKLKKASRRPIGMSQESLVTLERVRPGQTLPLVVKPASGEVDLTTWATSNRELIEEKLLADGGILFRGFEVRDVAEFRGFIKALYGELVEYRDRVQPRTQVSENIYTSTEYPADQEIELHNEAAYAHTWPRKIFFFCIQPAAEGGATPLCDCRKVLNRIAPDLRRRFIEKQVMYVRNLGDGFGVDWQSAFQTEDRSVMEDYCRRAHIQLEWKGENRLRTRSVRPVVVEHPESGEKVWFNAAISSHDSTLAPAVREALLRDYAVDELPKNSFYGDGSLLETDVLEALRQAYREETVEFDWQRGDVLMLDNMLVAHGRRSYRGERKLVVGMAQAESLAD